MEKGWAIILHTRMHIAERDDMRACKAQRRGCLQVQLFTATMPERLQEAARQWLRKPLRIHIHMDGASISPTITQVIYRLNS